MKDPMHRPSCTPSEYKYRILGMIEGLSKAPIARHPVGWFLWETINDEYNRIFNILTRKAT